MKTEKDIMKLREYIGIENFTAAFDAYVDIEVNGDMPLSELRQIIADMMISRYGLADYADSKHLGMIRDRLAEIMRIEDECNPDTGDTLSLAAREARFLAGLLK